MREIKFRAWDKKDECMRNVKMIDFSTKEIGVEGNQYGGIKWRKMDEVVLMQFTGMKDEKGNNIYDGDIVRKTSIEYDYYGNEHKTEWLGVVGYIAPKFIYKGIDGFYLAGTAGFVVVGNIYENPELLF